MGTALGRCVGDVDRFLETQWSRAPLHRTACEGPGFSDLLSLDDVDLLVSSSLPRRPTFRLVRDGTPLDAGRYTRAASLGGRLVPGVGDAGRIWQEFSAGATIVLQALHRSWLPLARFCRDLERELTHPAQANAYVTPPSARGLAVHHDTHDVFVLQVDGRKHWSVHPPVIELPLRSQPWSAVMGDAGEPMLTVELAPGDCLYVPRGFPHSARAQDGVSAHVTIGVNSWTGEDVVHEVVRRVDDELELRRPLPVGFAADEDLLTVAVADTISHLRRWLDSVDARHVARDLTRRFWSSRPAILAGQLRQLGLVDALDDSTVVRRRPSAVCHISVSGEVVEVVLGDRTLRAPAPLEPVLRRLASGQPLRVGALAGSLDMRSRHVLARRLVREGLMEVVLHE